MLLPAPEEDAEDPALEITRPLLVQSNLRSAEDLKRGNPGKRCSLSQLARN